MGDDANGFANFVDVRSFKRMIEVPQIHVWPGIGCNRGDGRREPWRQERVAIAHPPEIVVFYADRPIRCEAVFKACSDRPTPTCPFCLSQANARYRIKKIPPLVGDGCAALHVPESVVPGITDLTREKTQCIGFGGPSISREKQASVRVSEIGPVPLRLQSEYPICGLPTITNLAASDATACIAATFSVNDTPAVDRGDVEAPIATTIASVGADVEAAPIIDGGNHRRRCFGVRAGSKISRRCGCDHAQCN